MRPVFLLAGVAVVASATMTVAFVRARRTDNLGLVDVVWSALVGLSAVGIAALADGDPLPRLALAVVAGAWAIRLGVHLAHRVGAESEDGRYQAMRRSLGDRAAPIFAFFQVQALSVVLFAIPFVAVATNPVGSPGAVALGLSVAMLAIAGESVADRQLAGHRADPANRGVTCRAGLWAWSRHPNYFFEWLHWFAYLPLAFGGPWAPAALLGPVMMGLFLYRVSGIPWVEAQALRSRGDDYRAYQREVSAFFPLPPRRRTNP